MTRAQGRAEGEETLRSGSPTCSIATGNGSWCWLWLGFAAWFVFSKWTDIRFFALGDTDDNMRMMQVRGLLGGQDWFDLRQYRLNPPVGREHPLVAAGRPAARRADPAAQAVRRGRMGRAVRGGDRAAAALPAAAVLAGADRAAAGRPARLSAGLRRVVLRRLDQRHVHADADRPPWLAAGAARAGDRGDRRPEAHARRSDARDRDRSVAGDRARDADLPRDRRVGDGPVLGRRPRRGASGCAPMR